MSPIDDPNISPALTMFRFPLFELSPEPVEFPTSPDTSSPAPLGPAIYESQPISSLIEIACRIPKETGYHWELVPTLWKKILQEVFPSAEGFTIQQHTYKDYFDKHLPFPLIQVTKPRDTSADMIQVLNTQPRIYLMCLCIPPRTFRTKARKHWFLREFLRHLEEKQEDWHTLPALVVEGLGATLWAVDAVLQVMRLQKEHGTQDLTVLEEIVCLRRWLGYAKEGEVDELWDSGNMVQPSSG